MNIVTLEHVRKTFRQGGSDIIALDDVTLSIEKGEFTAIAGPSGSGKTTLLNVMGGLDGIDSGKVTLDGQLVETERQSALAEMRLHKVGFIFQAYNLIPVLSAVENVEFVMLLQGVSRNERRKKAMEVLDDVGLSGKYNRRPSELSGGQQQRVAVARAISADPVIVLADEPTANLDSATGRSLLELMKEMNEKRNVTFIFSTHDKMVMSYARRIIRIRDGGIETDGKHT